MKAPLKEPGNLCCFVCVYVRVCNITLVKNDLDGRVTVVIKICGEKNPETTLGVNI